jgi:DNA-binding XRE family transcriptional regulator
MANDSAIREPMIDAVLVKNANRMMTVASLLEHGIELSFADGAKGLIPYSDLPEIEESATLSTLELPNPYQLVLKTTQGETVDIPWDFARHYCDASYRPAVEAVAMQGRHTLSQRIRRLRKSAGSSQDALARSAGIGRVTLVRLEKGEQTPRYKTLGAIAKALGVDVSELLIEPELLRQ